MDKMERVAKMLDAAMPPEIRFLGERDPFRFLVSVVLSAQTTDEAVNNVVPVLFGAYPTRHDLAHAPLPDVERIIHRLGFFHTKALHVIALASALDGKEIPETIDGLTRLPGVGRKTANCYIGDMLGKPAIIVDTHFGRVVRRLGLVDSSDPAKIEMEVKENLDSSLWYRFSMTANLFGRKTCHAKSPECAGCFLSSLCPSRDAFPKASTT
jgi:endonuclease-3